MTCRLEIPKLSRYFRSFLLAYFVAKAKRLEYVCMVSTAFRVWTMLYGFRISLLGIGRMK